MDNGQGLLMRITIEVKQETATTAIVKLQKVIAVKLFHKKEQGVNYGINKVDTSPVSVINRINGGEDTENRNKRGVNISATNCLETEHETIEIAVNFRDIKENFKTLDLITSKNVNDSEKG